MNNEDFKRLTEEGISAIPKKFLEKIDNVAIVIEDNPTAEQVKKIKLKNNYVLFGLYEGIPRTKRVEYGQVIPDKITIFKNQIEAVANSDEEIREIIRDTVWHEIGHYFGMTEAEIRAAEKRRKKNKK